MATHRVHSLIFLFVVPVVAEIQPNETKYIAEKLIKDTAGCILPINADNKTKDELKEMCRFPIGTSNDEERCFGDLGCFPMEAPWTTATRPLPKPMSPDYMDLQLFFYSRNSPKKEQIVKLWPNISMDGVEYDPNRLHTTFISSGYLSYLNLTLIQQMKDDYLKARDANLFLIDWIKASQLLNYLQVSSNTRVVGAVVGRFVKFLIEERGLKPEQVHLIGHSLGSHVCSYIAKRNPNLGVLTAVEPAQLGFEGEASIVRLDITDAAFVEVLHTNSIPLVGLGFVKPVGHVDFYFNGGSYQKQCAKLNLSKFHVRSIEDLVLTPFEAFADWALCPHMMAWEYYRESIWPQRNCSFLARKTELENHSGIPPIVKDPFKLDNFSCDANTCTVFGLDTYKYPARGIFAIKTNTSSPYCLPDAEQYRKLQEAVAQQNDSSSDNTVP